jgi:hypothetical protein
MFMPKNDPDTPFQGAQKPILTIKEEAEKKKENLTIKEKVEKKKKETEK